MPMAKRLRHAASALAEVACNVVLSEVGSRREEENRLLLAKLVSQNVRQASVVALGHARPLHRRNALAGIIVNQPVLGLDYLPVEILVLDLVLTEVLLPGRSGGEHAARRESDERRAPDIA